MLDIDLSAKLVLALILHDVGDYLTQSDWMASEKTSKTVPALAHALVYTLPFLLVTTSPAALALIGVSHFAFDRFRLAKYWCWFKNFLAPRFTKRPMYATMLADQLIVSKIGEHAVGPDGKPVTWTTTVSYTKDVWWHPWSACSGTGYHKDKSPWMTVWLMIRADNTFHHLFNFLALMCL